MLRRGTATLHIGQLGLAAGHREESIFGTYPPNAIEKALNTGSSQNTCAAISAPHQWRRGRVGRRRRYRWYSMPRMALPILHVIAPTQVLCTTTTTTTSDDDDTEQRHGLVDNTISVGIRFRFRFHVPFFFFFFWSRQMGGAVFSDDACETKASEREGKLKRELS